jgi:hypothetical protein
MGRFSLAHRAASQAGRFAPAGPAANGPRTSSPVAIGPAATRPRAFGPLAFGLLSCAVILGMAGCGTPSTGPSQAVVDAEADLAREISIRDGLELEVKKLDGAKEIHLLRAQLISGEWRPPILVDRIASPIVRALPSWGILRCWRLWGRHPRQMPWFNEGVGYLMKNNTERKYEQDSRSLQRRLEAQEAKVSEAKKYLELVKSVGNEA